MQYVIKRNGKQESIKFDKVTARLQKLSYGLSPLINVIDVAKKLLKGSMMVCELQSLITLLQKLLHRLLQDILIMHCWLHA